MAAFLQNLITGLTIVCLVTAVYLFMRTAIGKKISAVLPTPFWIYFLSIVCATLGLLPNKSPLYSWISLYVLASALLLMLVGTSITEIIRMGPKAFGAIGLSIGSMVAATALSFFILWRWLSIEGWKVAGALLGTWTGGSANMVAVKEILSLSDSRMAPLIIVDTVLSYVWMALLIFGAGYQVLVNKRLLNVIHEANAPQGNGPSPMTRSQIPIHHKVFTIGVAGIISWAVVKVATYIAPHAEVLSTTGWALLISSTLALFLAMTPLRRLEKAGASSAGQFLLYIVLVSIGAKTTVTAALEAPVFLLFGGMILVLHGIFMFLGGRFFKMPLFLLATASQAAVGGPVSAPIVAAVYLPGQVHIGVLMAVFGALTGTYIGVLGGILCRWIAS